MTRPPSLIAAAAAIAALVGCQRTEAPADKTVAAKIPAAEVEPLAPLEPPTIPVEDTRAEAFAGIKPEETVRFTGTEPFWGGQVTGTALTYSTPENQDGADIAVTRFAGRGGVSWSGMYQAAKLVLAVTPGQCSDGMSDRIYPFVATLEVAGEQRSGCAWTERQPFAGDANS